MALKEQLNFSKHEKLMMVLHALLDFVILCTLKEKKFHRNFFEVLLPTENSFCEAGILKFERDTLTMLSLMMEFDAEAVNKEKRLKVSFFFLRKFACIGVCGSFSKNLSSY